MDPTTWAKMALAAVAIIEALQKTKPVSTEQTPLTPGEIAAIDEADRAMNDAVTAWDAPTSDTPPENQT